MESVLIVGGSGFLGLHLIEAFYNLEPRPAVHILDTRAPEPLPDYKFDVEKVKFHRADITDADAVEKVVQEAHPKVVVHCVSPVHGMGAQVYKNVNVVGTKTLVEACQKENVKAFVYTSSAGVAFNGADLFGADETWPFPKKAMDAYNETKQHAEVFVLEKNGEKAMQTVALRPAGIFGPGDRQMIPQLRNLVRTKQNRVQLGNNDNLFDVTYVGNVAYAHVLAAEKLLAGADDVAGEAFYITNDEPIYFWSWAKLVWKQDNSIIDDPLVLPKPLAMVLGHLAELASKIMGKEPTFTAFRVTMATATRYFDISKAKRYLGYTPKWTLREAIDETFKRL